METSSVPTELFHSRSASKSPVLVIQQVKEIKEGKGYEQEMNEENGKGKKEKGGNEDNRE